MIDKAGNYHCTVDLLFDWYGISCMTTDNFCFYLQNRWIQTSQTGGQWYSDTSPFSIPWLNTLWLFLALQRWHCELTHFTCLKVLLRIWSHLKQEPSTGFCSTREYLRRKYHCTVDLLFDWFGISCMTTDNFLLLFAKQTNPDQSNRRSTVQWYFPL